MRVSVKEVSSARGHYCVQAKRSSRLVGVQAVQQVVAARAFYDCEQSMVVTNSYFTEQAMFLARKNGVRLRHRDNLAKNLCSSTDTRTLA